MYLLGQKDDKPWWHKQDGQGHWVPVSQEEADAYRDYWNNKRDEIAARIFNEAFNKDQKP